MKKKLCTIQKDKGLISIFDLFEKLFDDFYNGMVKEVDEIFDSINHSERKKFVSYLLNKYPNSGIFMYYFDRI